MSHTPGPWQVGKHSSVVGTGILDTKRNAIAVCLYGASLDEIEANARLIAAAPGLASELKHATDHIHDLRIVLEQAREMGLTLHMCGVTYDHEKALAVLAKATGGGL